MQMLTVKANIRLLGKDHRTVQAEGEIERAPKSASGQNGWPVVTFDGKTYLYKFYDSDTYTDVYAEVEPLVIDTIKAKS